MIAYVIRRFLRMRVRRVSSGASARKKKEKRTHYEQHGKETLASLRGFTCCIPNATEGGVVLGVGAMEADEIRSSTAMAEAYRLGRSV